MMMMVLNNSSTIQDIKNTLIILYLSTSRSLSLERDSIIYLPQYRRMTHVVLRTHRKRKILLASAIRSPKIHPRIADIIYYFISSLTSSMKTMVPPARNPVASVAFILLHFLLSTSTLTPCNAFTTLSSESTRFAITPATRTSSSLYSSNDDSFVDKVTKGYESFQSARGEGYDFKQSVAIAIAGDYDADSVKAKIQEDIASAPCVM